MSFAQDVESLAGQVLVAGFPGRSAPAVVTSATRAGHLGGVILFKQNLGTPREIAALVAELVAGAPEPLLVSVDQEGGRVARLGPPVLRLPPMRRLGAHPALLRRAAAHLGKQLRALGFTMDFAPVLDVDTNPDNPVIGDRAFGAEPEVVIRAALAFAAGLADAGLLSCGKHFPGHGDTDLDSHVALPRLRHDRARLDAVELAPFRATAEAELPAIMTAHVAFDELDPGVPATLSKAVIEGLLRRDLGYRGVVVSDDLEMSAVRDQVGIPEGAVRAIEAGCDALLVCKDLDALARAREALARRATDDAAFRARLEDAARRFVALRRRAVPAPRLDASALEEALDPAGTAALEAEIARAIGGGAE